MVLGVLCSSNGPFVLGATRVRLFCFGIVEANISFSEHHIDGREFAFLRPANAVVIFKEGIEERALELDFFFVVEWQS